MSEINLKTASGKVQQFVDPYKNRGKVTLSSNNMSRQRKNLFFWIMVIMVAFGLVTLTWGLWSKGSLSTVEFIGWITGALLPGLGFLYHLVKKYSLSFFLFTNRVRSIFSTHTLTWDLYANIQSENVNEDAMNQVVAKLVHFRNGATTTKIQRVNSYESIVFINAGPTLHISTSYRIMCLNR